jgi:hypothetical protein
MKMRSVLIGAFALFAGIGQASACMHHIGFSHDKASAEAELARTIKSLDGDEQAEAWGMLRALAGDLAGGTGSDEGSPGPRHPETATD